MKKSLSLILLIPLLASCDIGKGINCSEIYVRSGGATIVSGEYSESYSRVYEYKNSEGKCLYTSYYREKTEDLGNYEVTSPVELKVYKEKYSNNFETYKFSDFIGYLTEEHIYYYNKTKKMVDVVIKYSEYKHETDPSDKKGDNSKAFKCAKKGYYTDIDYISYFSSENYCDFKLYDLDGSLERHSYIALGDDANVEYIEKK